MFHRELALSKQELKKYEESFQDLSPICDRNIIRNLQPNAQSPAIPHLSIHLDSILCLYCENQERPYICRSETHMREHLRLTHRRQFHHRGQRYKNGIIEAWQEAGVACAPVACQTLFKLSSNRRYFPVLAPELESKSVSEPILSEISHAPASTVDGSGELDAGVSSAYLQSCLPLETLIEEKLNQAAQLAATPAQHTQDQLQRQVSPTSEQYRWIQFTECGRYLAEYPLKVAARLLDLPAEKSWNSGDMSGDGHCGNEHERQLQSECALQHILAALKRLVEQARKTMSDGRFNVFDQHRLNSFLPRRTSGRAFFYKLQDNTYKRYVRVSQKLICFVYRRAWAGTGPSLPFRLTEAQMTALTDTVHAAAALQSILVDSERDDEYLEETWTRLEDNLLILYVSLLDHALYRDIYESPIVGFHAVLAIQETDSGVTLPYPRLYEAIRYTPYLSAFVKISQLLVAERALLAVQRDEFEYPGLALEDMQHRFMVEGTRSPICWAQKLRAYGKAIKDTTTSIGHIQWSDDDETLSYKDTQFTMTQLRNLVSTELEIAQAQLSDLLLIHPEDDDRELVVPSLSLRSLADNPAESAPGWSFICHPKNTALHGHEKWLLNRILPTTWLRNDFFRVPKRAIWREQATSLLSAPFSVKEEIHHLSLAHTLVKSSFTERGTVFWRSQQSF